MILSSRLYKFWKAIGNSIANLTVIVMTFRMISARLFIFQSQAAHRFYISSGVLTNNKTISWLLLLLLSDTAFSLPPTIKIGKSISKQRNLKIINKNSTSCRGCGCYDGKRSLMRFTMKISLYKANCTVNFFTTKFQSIQSAKYPATEEY